MTQGLDPWDAHRWLEPLAVWEAAHRRRKAGIRLAPSFARLGDLLDEGQDYLLERPGLPPLRVRFLRWERRRGCDGALLPWRPLVTKVKPSGALGGCCWFLEADARLDCAPPLAPLSPGGMGGGDAPRRPLLAAPLGDRAGAAGEPGQADSAGSARA